MFLSTSTNVLGPMPDTQTCIRTHHYGAPIDHAMQQLTCDMSHVTIDTNHVMVDDLDVTIERKYVTQDDTDATTSM